MAVIETFACDQCQIQKQASNNWWKVFLLKATPEKACGVLVLEWNADVITDPVMSAEKKSTRPSKADAHICGSKCLLEWISKRVLEQTQ